MSRALSGSRSSAGSPTAAHTARPAGSVKPATGFQAARAPPSTPRCSQPFQGKSLSFTVRRKIGEATPACESTAMFSTPSL
jgi:hypothetical protein